MSTRDFEHKQIAFVFTTEGEKISFKNDNLIVSDADGKIKHQSTCYRLFALFICGDYCVTTGLLERSQAIMPSKAEGNVLLRKIQYAYNDTCIGAHIISNKIHNQCSVLKKKRKKTSEEKSAIEKLEIYKTEVLKPGLSAAEIMGLEGISAKLYFKTLFSEYDWKAREPRAKRDKINTLMDIGYTILFNFVNALLEMYGFDVYVGVLHTQFFHRKSLVCDLEEPFRPVVDRAIIKSLNLGQISDKDFWKNQNQYILPWKNSKKYIGILLEAIMEYKSEIFIYLQSYYRAFIRNKPVAEFPVFDLSEDN